MTTVTPDFAGFQALIAEREGKVLSVYKDSLGVLTCGIGHKVLPEDGLQLGDPITEAQCDAFFAVDGKKAWDAAVAQATQANITSPAFLPYLASVCYQLGVDWTAEFPLTWGEIMAGDYRMAASFVAHSMWARETPVRVTDFQNALLNLPTQGAEA
jgi:GH24 family phage-related lysozyme (muramidase)